MTSIMLVIVSVAGSISLIVTVACITKIIRKRRR
jgi:hypothetical protein